MRRFQLLRNAYKRVRLFERIDHLRGSDQGRVVGHAVDLVKLAESSGYVLDTGPPFQGVFSHVVSVDVENNLLSGCRMGDDAHRDQHRCHNPGCSGNVQGHRRHSLLLDVRGYCRTAAQTGNSPAA